MSDKKDNSLKEKTITGGSDASAGFLIPEDKGDNKKSYKQTRLSSQQAQTLIQSVLRGTVETIIDSIGESNPAVAAVTETTTPAEKVSPATLVAATLASDPVLSTPVPAPATATASTPAVLTDADLWEGGDIAGKDDEVSYNARMVNASGSPTTTTPGIPAVTLVHKPIVEAVLEDTTLKNFAEKQLADESASIDGSVSSVTASVEPVTVPPSVPNYRKPEDTTRICSTCRFYQAIDGDSGRCTAYGFVAKAEYTCDSWSVNKPETNGVDSDRVPVVDESGNVTDDGPVKEDAPSKSVPNKYKQIDFSVPTRMTENAQSAIEVRSSKPVQLRGMSMAGLARAIQIVENGVLSPDTWQKLYIFFKNCSNDFRQGEKWDQNGPNWQAWYGNGGVDGQNRAFQIFDQIRKADIENTATSMNLPVPVVTEWYDAPVPEDIANKPLYIFIRGKVRDDCCQRQSPWSIYDSIRLRKAYQQIAQAEESGEPFVKSVGVKIDLLKSIEDEVFNQGGQIKRVKSQNSIMGFDDIVGFYSPTLLNKWMSEDWCDIVNKTPDGRFSSPDYYWVEDSFSIVLPRSVAESMGNDQCAAIVNKIEPFYKSMKIVDCSKIPAELRKNYPECDDDYKPPRVDEDGVSHYLVGSIPDPSDIDGKDDTPSNSDDGDAGDSGDSGDSGSASGSGSSGSSGGSGGGEATASDDMVPEKSMKSAVKIRVVSGPVSEIAGGEIIDKDLKPKTSNEDHALPLPTHSANLIDPELSLPHGTRKNIPIYLPGDRVYSKTFNSLGEVVKSQVMDGEVVYSVKLIDRMGVVHGNGIVQETDLSPRSMRAMKRMRVKTLRDVIKSDINNVITTLEDMSETHQDFTTNPVDQITLNEVLNLVKSTLANKDFEDASSEMDMRKYVRAMQDVEHSIGAAINLMQTAEEYMETLGNDDASFNDVFNKTQQNVYDRIASSIIRAKESLMEDTPMRSYVHRRK